jgi:preprotein translocase subunit SecE
MNFFKKTIDFLKEARVELKKVKWPTKKETLQYTLVVIIISIAVAIYLGGLDYIFSFILKKFIVR